MRSDETSSAIRAAVVAELAGVGYGRLTIDNVARRARVGKNAIYRRWDGKADMVLGLLGDLGIEAANWADTGSLAGDLRALLARGAEQLGQPLVRRIVPDLLAEAARDSEFGAELHRRIGSIRRERGTAMLLRAIERGELVADTDLVLGADLIAAPLYWRIAVTRDPFGVAELDRLTASLLAALRAAHD